MDCDDNSLDNCSGIKLVALSASISAILAENLSLDDQNVVSNILSSIGQNLALIAAQNSKYQSCIESFKDSNTTNTTNTTNTNNPNNTTTASTKF